MGEAIAQVTQNRDCVTSKNCHQTEEQRIVNRRWIVAVVIIAVALILAMILSSSGSKLLEDLVDSAIVGPGLADYSFELVGDYMLVRSGPNRRSINMPSGIPALPGDRAAPSKQVIKWDVTQLGWNNRYIVCFQAPNQDAGGTQGWWIIDTQNQSRIGPMKESNYQKQLLSLGEASEIVVHPVESYGRTGTRTSP